MSARLTVESIQILIDYDDESFVGMLVDWLRATPRDDIDYTLLYHPDILHRLAIVYHSNHPLWEGVFAPNIRSHKTIWYPDFLAKIQGVGKEYDPFLWQEASSILKRPVLPVRWLVPGLIPDGLTIIGGTPKSGKSYLAYTLALAVAQYGTWANHFEVGQGDVLFLSLEDDIDDTRQRLHELDPVMTMDHHHLLFLHGQDAIPRFDSGAIEWLTQAIEHHKPRLVVIDPVSYLYVLKRTGNLFEETKDMLFPLRWLGKQNHCAIVCLDHRRKRSKDDVSVFDTLYGSQAKAAVADALLMVERDETDITMAALIRRGKDQTLHFDFTFKENQAFLTYKGESTIKTSHGALRATIDRVLRESNDPLSISEIAFEAELPNDKATKEAIWQALSRMVKAREVDKTTRGKYFSTKQEAR